MKKTLTVCSIAWVVAWATFARARDSNKLTVRVLDGQPIAARVNIVGSDGKPYAPAGSILRQPEAATPYFYIDGKFVVTLPPGSARMVFWRGIEYLPGRVDVDLQTDTEITVRLVRWVYPAEQGWYSGDSHIHLHTGGPIKVEIADALLAARAEDLNFSNLCVSNNVGDDIRDAEFITGKPYALSDEQHLLVFGEEMRSSIYGHMQFFVTVAGKPIASKKDAAFFIEWIDRLIDSMGRRNRYAKPEDRQRVEALFRLAQTRFQEIATADR